MTPLPVDEHGDPAEKPDDYNKEYLPKDGRPMSHGSQDRYGNVDMTSSVGFFPVEHKKKPPDPDHDAVQSLNAGLTEKPEEEEETPFDQQTEEPKVNDPDVKYMVRLSKYGTIVLQGDQGYHWQKTDDSGELGEFEGDFSKDEDFEKERWKYLQRLLNEDKPKNTDQRRFMILTRYGHFEKMRDVGWKKTRVGEYTSEKRVISKDSDRDERWVKTGTKGGWFFQMCDVGFDAEEDEFVKRTLIEDTKHREEYEKEWETEDKRIARLVSRHGFKIVVDDRGSDDKEAEKKENPRGRGLLLKGRRTPGSMGEEVEGDERGFFWEFNEKDESNHTTWGTPSGLVVQMSDKHQYMLLASRKSKYPEKFVKYKNAEFHDRDLADGGDAGTESYHVLLDHHNEYLRIKTRSGKGDGPVGIPVNPPGVLGEESQGLECRDGSKGDDPWVELVDSEKRGLFFHGKKGVTVLRSKLVINKLNPLLNRFTMYSWMDEKDCHIVIRNVEDEGIVQIFCENDVQVIGKNVDVHAKGKAIIRGDKQVLMAGGGTRVRLISGKLECTSKMYAPDFVKTGVGIGLPEAPEEIEPPQLEPTNRNERHNTQPIPPPETPPE